MRPAWAHKPGQGPRTWARGPRPRSLWTCVQYGPTDLGMGPWAWAHGPLDICAGMGTMFGYFGLALKVDSVHYLCMCWVGAWDEI